MRSSFAAIICVVAGSVHAQDLHSGATCNSTGIVRVAVTIRVTAGTFDGGCRTFVPLRMNAAASTKESSVALLFRVENGATLRNVIIDRSPEPWSARAIAVYRGARLHNVKILNAYGDSYVDIKSESSLTMTRFTAFGSPSLIRHVSGFGPNTSVNMSDCFFIGGREVYGQRAGTIDGTSVIMDMCNAEVTDQVFRTESPFSTATIGNSFVRYTHTICSGYQPILCMVLPRVTFLD